jgi:hypothetical protein
MISIKFKLLIISTFIFISNLSYSQNQGFIDSGKIYKNTSSDTLFFTNMENLDKILEQNIKLTICEKKVTLFNDQVATLYNRVFTSDSTIALLKAEAEFWKMKLDMNDQYLEQQRIENLNLVDKNKKLRNSRLYFFIGGIVASSIVFIAVK